MSPPDAPATLRAELESPLPPQLEAGQATGLFCSGVCFHGSRRVRGVEIVVDGARHRPAAWRMPRPDAHERFGGAAGSYRSGWWGTVPVFAGAAGGRVAIELAVRYDGGGEELASLAQLEVAETQGMALAPVPAGEGELIAVCMATYEPDPELLRAQIESLRAQTDTAWVCVISDDCSPPESFAEVERLIAGDERFAASRSESRLGFYRNFERAIRLAPGSAPLLAWCDQDDSWHPDKLATLRGAIGSMGLVYSDQRLVDPTGRVLAETLWRGRDNNHTDIASMLVANSVTGAASLFRRGVADLMVPFPDSPGLQFHDHWLGLVGLAAGDVGYVDRALYDYVQHEGAVFSEVSVDGRVAKLGSGPPWRALVERWRMAYFYGYLGREVQAQVLLARCGEGMEPAKRRALERFVAADRSAAALAWLVLRPVRRLMGRNDTLGSELQLATGPLWRRIAVARAGRRETPGPHPVHASFPDAGAMAFEQSRLRRWRSGRARGESAASG